MSPCDTTDDNTGCWSGSATETLDLTKWTAM
jgi:hypothetical protein